MSSLSHLLLFGLLVAAPLAAQTRLSPDDSARVYRDQIAAAEGAGDSVALANAHNSLGLLHWSENRYDSSLVHLRAGRDLRAAMGDLPGLGRSLNNIGASHYQAGNYEPALESFVRALDVRRTVGDERGVALVQTNIGKTYHDWRQYERARDALQGAVETAERLDDSGVLGYALHALALVHVELGEYARARELLDRSAVHYARSAVTADDSTSGRSIVNLARGTILVREGRFADALPVLNSVLRTAEDGESARGLVSTLLIRGKAYRGLGQPARAVADYERALSIARAGTQRVLALEALNDLAATEEARGNPSAALRHLREHNALRDSIFSQATAQRVASMEARAEAERQQRENARLMEQQRGQRLTIARQRTVVVLGSALLVLAGALVGVLVHFNRKGIEREQLLATTNAELQSVNAELRTALGEVRALSGLIPICANCKKVRDDRGFWEAVETYIANRSEAQFSHSICATCGPELYGADWHSSAPEEVEGGTAGR